MESGQAKPKTTLTRVAEIWKISSIPRDKLVEVMELLKPHRMKIGPPVKGYNNIVDLQPDGTYNLHVLVETPGSKWDEFQKELQELLEN